MNGWVALVALVTGYAIGRQESGGAARPGGEGERELPAAMKAWTLEDVLYYVEDSAQAILDETRVLLRQRQADLDELFDLMFPGAEADSGEPADTD